MNAGVVNVLRHTFVMIIGNASVPMHAAAITIAPMIQFARTMNAWFVNVLRHTFAWTMNAGDVIVLRHTFAMIIGNNVSVRTSVAATMTVRMEPWVIVVRTIFATIRNFKVAMI